MLKKISNGLDFLRDELRYAQTESSDPDHLRELDYYARFLQGLCAKGLASGNVSGDQPAYKPGVFVLEVGGLEITVETVPREHGNAVGAHLG